MISLEEAQARLIAMATPLPEEEVLLPDAIGRWAARPIRSRRDSPGRDMSAMDGYAVAASDLPGPFFVIGESAAGHPFRGRIEHGQAVRIFTGAALPHGADTVIIQEDVTVRGTWIDLSHADGYSQGTHVRLAGNDFHDGDILIGPGERMTPARIALAASGGYATIPARRRPSVEIIATGDELVPPGLVSSRSQTPESNAIMLAAMLHDFRCSVSSPGVLRDDKHALVEAILSSKSDILVTVGGASVGDHDLAKPALEECGAVLDFWKVAMRPGKPVMAGRLGNRIVLGLPGNPVSAYVTCLLFLRPLVASLSGAGDPLPRRGTAQLALPLPANGTRTDHIRARLIGGMAEPVGRNDSAALLSLAQSDALIVRAPNAPPAKSGDEVDIVFLS